MDLRTSALHVSPAPEPVGSRREGWRGGVGISCTAVLDMPAHVGVICQVIAPVSTGVPSPGTPLTHSPNATQAPENILAEHYHDLRRKPFYPALINYMSSGPVVAMVWPGGRGRGPWIEPRAAELLVIPSSSDLYLCAAGLGRPQCGLHFKGHDRAHGLS